ncbi:MULTISPECIES: 3-oxoacyl-ACP reductase FabG [Sporosarcina]|uniref:3-oxoacyl-ACP reductase FabG n=1 Tax=Sporosarcina contaminans TaxID=633403 RepID=A0ABW3TXQ0_9BACL
MRMKGKTVVITGGGSGIGAVAANVFGKEGAQVAIIDFNEIAGEETAKSLHGEGIEAAFFKANVADQEQVQSAAQKVLEHFGKVDVLINNAGITKDAMLVKMEANDFRQVVDVNLTGVFYCTQAFLPTMLAAGKGKIVNTSSIAGTGGNIGQTNYSAAKAGVIGMTRTWAKEYGRKGINVNAVAPGFIETDMIETIPEKVLEQMKLLTPSARMGKPEDIASAYLFLSSEEADFINGTVLEVDGGMLK